jgi:putative acyl-CoA dehydrogenase
VIAAFMAWRYIVSILDGYADTAPPSVGVSWSTHEVTNQPPSLIDWDPAAYPAVLEGLRREGAGWYESELHRLGLLAGDGHNQQLASDADRNPPRLLTHDRFGQRIDEVAYHPAYHRLMETAIDAGLAGAPWADDFEPAGAAPGSGHVARAAGFFTWSHTELGHGCPLSMTYAIVPALRREPELARAWEPGVTAREYDPGLRWRDHKRGLTAGMAMTEKQGGSDVRANTTTARDAGDGTWRLVGHKWFCSAPMSDVFLVLAQTSAGLTCFLLPRVLPDGTRNALRIQRLKDKLGNRANASSEVEFHDAVVWRVGEEGRGVATIIEMVAATRIDCIIGAASCARHAVAQAAHHVAHRRAFGKRLVEQQLMANVIADLAVECEAMTSTMLRLAGAFGRSQAGDDRERMFARLAVPVMKYWVTRRAVNTVAEALECIGGNGYVEESVMPRIYREVPLQSLWEGSGNVQALDMLRAMIKAPDAVDVVLDEIDQALGADDRFDIAVAALRANLADNEGVEYRARALAEQLACTLQAALLIRHAPAVVADAYCATRLAGGAPRQLGFGTLPRGYDTATIIARATPSPA